MTDKIAIRINGEQIATVNSFDAVLDSFEYEYYMRRGNNIYLRNRTGKIKLTADKIGTELDEIKYGTKLIIGFD